MIVLMGWYLPVGRTGFGQKGVQVRSRRNQLVEQRSKEAPLPLAISHLQQSGLANAAILPSGIICHRIQADALKVGACELCGEHLPDDVIQPRGSGRSFGSGLCNENRAAVTPMNLLQ